MNCFDVAIVGAGIVGCAIAREAAQAGLRTVLIEANSPGSGITAAAMGHIVVMDDSPSQLALTRYSRELWRQDADRMPATGEYDRCGTVWVAANEAEMEQVQVKQQTYASAGVASEVFDADRLRAEEPNLRAGLAGGLLVPDDGVVYPPAAAAFYLREALARGATLLHARVVQVRNGMVVLTDGTQLHAGRTVLAVGSECDLLPALPVQKRKGHLVITERYPGFLRHQLVELGYLKSAHTLTSDSVAFNIQPRPNGQLLIGSSRQYGSTDREVEAHILRQMMERAVSYMPRLAALTTLRVWTGFRAAVRDKLPLLGPAAQLSVDPNLWLAAGFEGLGITSAPGAARLLLDQMLHRPSAIESSPFLPARLAAAEARLA